jgi:hypothetical protein
MSYDPLKALQSAGVLEGPMPTGLEKAIATLTQEEVDLIIANRNRLPANLSQMLAWTAPNAAAMSAQVQMSCLCGIWSGSGAGHQQQA